MIVPDSLFSQCIPVFENTNVQLMSLALHDHMDFLFDFLVNHQLADDIKYCTQQVLGDLILLNSPSEMFCIPANIAQSKIAEFSNNFTPLFNKMCDETADIVFAEHSAKEACQVMNKILNDWLLSLRHVYNRRIIPILTPPCFKVKTDSNLAFENSSHLAQMYKFANAMSILATAYMNKYNSTLAPPKKNLHDSLCKEYATFLCEPLQGALLIHTNERWESNAIKLAQLLRENASTQLVLERSFPMNVEGACEEVFRATYACIACDTFRYLFGENHNAAISVHTSSEQSPPGKEFILLHKHAQHGILNFLELFRTKLLPKDRVLIMLELARTIAHMHAMGIMHLRVFASRIFFTNSTRVAMTGFAIPEPPNHNSYRQIIYEPPEIDCYHKVFTPEVDIFGLGILMYEIWTMARNTKRFPNMLYLSGELYEPALVALLVKCTDKDAQKRCSIYEVVNELEEVLYRFHAKPLLLPKFCKTLFNMTARKMYCDIKFEFQ